MNLPPTSVAVGKLAAGPGHIGLRTQEIRPPRQGEVTVAVVAAGICGTDLHIADDEYPSNPPVTMGHEVTGIVAATGEGVDPAWVGRRVALETYFHTCQVCEHCRDGRPNLCAERRSIGSHVDGGFASHVTVPSRNLHELPEAVGRHAGALAEPLACVCQCLFDPAVIDAGDRVLVTGPGTMGLLTAQAARAAGGEVTVAGLPTDGARLDVAARLGFATHTVGVDPPPGPPDVFCECSGAQAGAAMGLELLPKGGRYVQVGIFGTPVTVDLDTVLYKEIIVTSGFASTPRAWRRAMRLLESGAVALDPLVTDVVPLVEWERAFAATRNGEGMKFVLAPQSETG